MRSGFMEAMTSGAHVHHQVRTRVDTDVTNTCQRSQVWHKDKRMRPLGCCQVLVWWQVIKNHCKLLQGLFYTILKCALELAHVIRIYKAPALEARYRYKIYSLIVTRHQNSPISLMFIYLLLSLSIYIVHGHHPVISNRQKTIFFVWHGQDSNSDVGVTKSISPVPLFSSFSTSPNHTLAIENHIYIWRVSPQLSCDGTYQTWMWFKESSSYFCKTEYFPNGNINERSISNPTPQVHKKNIEICMYVFFFSETKRPGPNISVPKTNNMEKILTPSHHRGYRISGTS